MALARLTLFVENARNEVPAGTSARYLESFGLFGGASNNMNTFNPGLDVNSDVVPKEEDFIRVPFRLLSATVVAAGSWRSTDFGNEAVLKKSMRKLVGKPVYIDHDTDSVVNNVGVIEEVKWTAAKDGVPGGIDGILKIDAKANPKVARGVLSNPPSIGSFSVTVSFDWEQSHKFENDYEFENNIGKVINGKMVTRKATLIHDYFEGSLVWLGADPYAKIRDNDGNLLNIDRSSVFQNSRRDPKEESLFKNTGQYCVSYSFKSFEEPTLNPKIMTLAQMLAKLGLESLDGVQIEGLHILTPEQLQSQVASATNAVTEKLTKVTDELTQAKDSITSLTTEVTTLKDSEKTATDALAALTNEVEQYKADSVKFNATLTHLREKTKAAYLTFSEGKPNEAISAVLEKASYEELQAFFAEYAGKNATEFGGKCDECGSGKISFGTSSQARLGTVTPAKKGMSLTTTASPTFLIGK